MKHARDFMITVISMVNNEQLYKECIVNSTENYKDQIEYVPLHNVTHPTKAYNQAIQKTAHNLIVCCHQDIIFLEDVVACIENALSKLSNWGVLGLAGTTFKDHYILYNFHPHDRYTAADHKAGEICKAMTIDGFCVILDKRKPLRFDEKLEWWHFYGEDIALQANDLGLGTYVIPCRCHHVSPRTIQSLPDNGGFDKAANRMRRKWRRKRPIYTTVGSL